MSAQALKAAVQAPNMITDVWMAGAGGTAMVRSASLPTGRHGAG
jgi:hypothetical protein